MQRRLTLALAITALASIVLVGLGILAMAQFTARSNAEREVTQRLEAVADLTTDENGRLVSFRRVFEGARNNLGLDLLDLAVIDPAGEVRRIERTGRRPAAGPAIDGLVIDDDQRARLQAGETVLTSEADSVFGLQAVRFQGTDGAGGQADLVLVAGQRVTAVTGRVIAWFLLSSAVVLLGAVAAGAWMARRLVGPIKAIESTTSSIAAGDLGARVDVDGRDEVAELGQSVNRMASDLERSKALDRQFLMSVSHDLRTPLTAISGYAEALRDGAVPDPQAAGQVIGANADRLRGLVDDLLDLARLDANRFRFDTRTFDLGVIAGRTAAGLDAAAEQRGITIDRTGLVSVMVLADPDRTAQAIGNLIDNGLKFATGRLTISTGVTAGSEKDARSGGDGTGGGTGWVTVADDGPGIPPEDLPHIFDRLYTGAAQPERAENPTGLGLAIVRELVHAMGGEVEPSNAPGGGASLTIRLPLEPGATAGGSVSSEPSARRPEPEPGSRQGSGPPARPEPTPTASDSPTRPLPTEETVRPS